MHAYAQSLSCVQLVATPWMVAYQIPLSMGFSKQEYWRGCLLQGIILDLGIESPSSVSSVLSGGFLPHEPSD